MGSVSEIKREVTIKDIKELDKDFKLDNEKQDNSFFKQLELDLQLPNFTIFDDTTERTITILSKTLTKDSGDKEKIKIKPYNSYERYLKISGKVSFMDLANILFNFQEFFKNNKG